VAKVVILTGAGISAESGISTFRDTGGLWENYSIEEICSAGCLETNRDTTLDFYDMRRLDIKPKEPNYAHKTLVQLQQKYPKDIVLITQNVDNMFEKAGAKEVMHLHGFLPEVSCMNESCDFTEDIGYELLAKERRCPLCQTLLRPNIVFFGEAAPMYAKMYKEFDDCEFFVVIGTSGYVINTDMFLNPDMKYTILNNLEQSPMLNGEYYSKVLYKKATEAIDEIKEDIERYLGVL